MKAKLRSAYGFDVDLSNYCPEDSSKDGIWLRLMVGPNEGEGEESFDVLVCTPRWLEELVAADGPVVGAHHLIVQFLDLELALNFLKDRIESFEAPNWRQLAQQISRIGYWEFQEYRP